jgi:hypothetical protein
MRNTLIIILSLCLGTLLLFGTFHFINREQIAWVEGAFSVSPTKKWAIYLRTTSTSDPVKSFSQIFLFDADVYPDIVTRNFPTRYQLNNPTASFLVPIQLYARVATVKFSDEGNQVTIKQGAINHLLPVAYVLDLGDYTFHSISADSTVKPSGMINKTYTPKPDAQNDPGVRYTCYAGLFPPFQPNSSKLQAMLNAEGYESYREGEEEVAMVLGEKNLRKLFHARIRSRKVGYSASSGFKVERFLDSAIIPERFQKLVRQVYLDPQRD